MIWKMSVCLINSKKYPYTYENTQKRGEGVRGGGEGGGEGGGSVFLCGVGWGDGGDYCRCTQSHLVRRNYPYMYVNTEHLNAAFNKQRSSKKTMVDVLGDSEGLIVCPQANGLCRNSNKSEKVNCSTDKIENCFILQVVKHLTCRQVLYL